MNISTDNFCQIVDLFNDLQTAMENCNPGEITIDQDTYFIEIDDDFADENWRKIMVFRNEVLVWKALVVLSVKGNVGGYVGLVDKTIDTFCTNEFMRVIRKYAIPFGGTSYH